MKPNIKQSVYHLEQAFFKFRLKEDEYKKNYYQENNILYMTSDTLGFSNETVKKFIESQKDYFSEYSYEIRKDILKGFLEEIKNRINLNIFDDCLNSIKDLKSLEEQKKNNFQEIFKIVFNTYNEYNEESIEKKIIEYNLNKLLFNFLPSMTAKRVESFFNQIDCYSTTSTKDQLNNSICFEFDNLVEELASRKELDKKVRCILLADNSKHGIYLACEALSKLPNKQEKDDLINLMKIFAFDESLIQKQDEIKEPSTKNELSDLQGLDDLKISK